ncbi:hypothetical protein B0H11DRAFT_1911022 [Mycena galericulata]|nr:hypothetical protein B0H11DRAFT_1911022 [Mycena galericulata]
MHTTSTINPKTQSMNDIPVVLVTLEGKSKFLPRAETYKEMQRLVRAHYDIDNSAVLQFEVSTLDVCGGQNVEVPEAAYALLAPVLDSVSVVVAQSGRDRVMPTPSATPSLPADDGSDDEQSVRDQLEPEPSRGRTPRSPPRRPATRAPKVESEEEEIPVRSSNAENHTEHLSATQEVEEGQPETPKKLFHIQAKEERTRTPTKVRAGESAAAVAGSSRAPANLFDQTAEPSQDTTSDTDERFKVSVTGPRPGHKAEFTTRGGHLVRKVLKGVCKTFKLDITSAKLLLCVPLEEGDEALVECDPEETVAHSGVKPNSRLVVRVGDEEAEVDSDESESE